MKHLSALFWWIHDHLFGWDGTLRGKDAERFMKAIEDPLKIPRKEYEKCMQVYRRFRVVR